MSNFMKSLKDKKVRYGSFSTLMIIIVISIMLVVNLVVGQLGISADLTDDKIYSITQQTREALADIDKPVTIYALFRTGESSYFVDIFRELLGEYPTVNKNISLEFMDPYLYPHFVQRYAKEGEEIPNGSVIVECGDKYKVIPQNNLISVGYDTSTFQQYVKSVDIEPQVTNAIRYVVSGKSSTVYFVSNHNESPLDSSVINQLSYENFEVKEIDLMMTDAIPEDCDLLFVTTPGKDWSADEANMVREYLQNDGRAAFFVDLSSEELTNLYGVLESYGVTFDKTMVVEANYRNMYMGTNPIYIVPNYKSHEITDIMVDRNYHILIAYAMPIETLSLKKNSTTVEALITSSGDSYSKDPTASTEIGKEAGDKSGPFDLAAAVTDSYYTDKQHVTKLFVMGTTSVLAPEIDSYTGGNDLNFVINALKWTQDNTQDIYIRPKTTNAEYSVNMSYQQAVIIIVVCTIAIPLAIIITGIVIWYRRRNS